MNLLEDPITPTLEEDASQISSSSLQPIKRVKNVISDKKASSPLSATTAISLSPNCSTGEEAILTLESMGNQPKKRSRNPEGRQTPHSTKVTKNIVKNYGKAICAFGASPLAVPYFEDLLKEENVELGDFQAYMNETKDKIDGLQKFRSIIMIDKEDSDTVKSFKKLYILCCEVFINYFSVNWVFNSKVVHKEAHLKFRFKMLRRIQNPELFTYLTSRRRSR